MKISEKSFWERKYKAVQPTAPLHPLPCSPCLPQTGVILIWRRYGEKYLLHSSLSAVCRFFTSSLDWAGSSLLHSIPLLLEGGTGKSPQPNPKSGNTHFGGKVGSNNSYYGKGCRHSSLSSFPSPHFFRNCFLGKNLCSVRKHGKSQSHILYARSWKTEYLPQFHKPVSSLC